MPRLKHDEENKNEISDREWLSKVEFTTTACSFMGAIWFTCLSSKLVVQSHDRVNWERKIISLANYF